MTNQQGAPEALLDPSPDQLRAIARTARNSSGSASDDCGPLAYVLHGWRAAAIAFRAQQAAMVEAQQPAPSAAVALSDDLRDRLVAISAAIADQDDRAAQAMLREILAAPQPSTTPPADSHPAPVLLSDEELCQIEEPYLLNFRIPLGGQYDFARAVEKAVIFKMVRTPASQGETNAQLDTDSNPPTPGQQRDVAGPVALGQPVGNGSDQAAGHTGAQGDKLLTVAERNIRSFLRSAVFKSESDREAALSCVDVLGAAARAPAGGEVSRLRAALVYTAYALHDTPKYMLADGITLIDGDTVRVSRDGWTVEASVNPARATPPARAPADSQPVPVVDKCTKQQMTTEVLRRMQQQEDGHNKNPFRSLLDRLMRNEGGYSTIEIGQLKYALDGFYGAARAPADSVTAPSWASHEKALEDALRERDENDEFIDTLLDEVLGADRAEWSSAYGRADALNDVQERMTTLHKPTVDKAWGRFQVTMAADSALEDAARIEQIAQQWDGCMYDAVGETIDIGQAIRDAARKQGGA